MYGPRLSAPLMWDDRPYLLDVSAYGQPIPLRAYASPAYFGFSGEMTWRPLATLSYSAGVRAFGKNPVLLRASMLALHLANVLLLGLLVSSAGLGPAAAFGAAALFLIHPVHLETLMTVTFNEELLATFGLLWMLLAHRRGRPFLAAAGLAFALLAKETGILGLALVPLWDRLTGERRRKDYPIYAAVGAAYLLLRFGPLKGPGGEANLSALLPFSERLFYAAEGFATSIRVLLAPFGLRIEYFALPASSPLVYTAWLLLAVAILGGILFLAWRERKRRPAFAFFLLWPLPILFLTSNLLPTGVLSLRLLAERWLYLPAAGVCVVLGWFLREKPRRLLLLIAVWGALGLWRARDWSDETRLWSSLVHVYPWSAKAVEGSGEALFRAGRTEEAKAAFEEGLRLRETRTDLVLAHYVSLAPPGTISWESPSLRRWLGLCALRLGDEKSAVAQFKISAALQPSDVFTDRVLAYLAAKNGDFSAARDWMMRGLARSPHDDFLLRLAPDVLGRRRPSFTARFD